MNDEPKDAPAPRTGPGAAIPIVREPARAGAGAAIPIVRDVARDDAERAPEPYRVMFPLGALFGAIGALLWTFYAAGWVAYPAVKHAESMIQGFETSFILGFFLTAMPAFTRGPKCHPAELAIAVLAMIDFGLFAMLGATLAAQISFGAAVLLLVSAAGRRLIATRSRPPEEFVFVQLGLALGLAGAVVLAAAATGWVEPAPRFGQRLVSFGMVLSLVLGFGSLLVPTFAMIKEPLGIPFVARPGVRGPRRALYLVLALMLIGAFAAEATGRAGAGAWLRAIAAVTIGLLGWKLLRLPGRRDLLSWALWTSGWMMMLGLLFAALDPLHAIGAYHFTFIGGFGLLTLGISTRVVVSHGGGGLEFERHVLTPWTVGALGLALVTRIAAEFVPPSRTMLLALSGVFWTMAWALWAAGALPMLRRKRPALYRPTPPPAMRATPS